MARKSMACGCGFAALGGTMKLSKFWMIVLLVVFSAMSGYVGYTFGVPAVNGPCTTDSTNTCSFTCTPVAGTNNQWVASSSTTQVPYCKDTNIATCKPSEKKYS